MKRFSFILSLMVIFVFNVFAEEDVFSYYPNSEMQVKFLWKDNKLTGVSGGFYNNNKLIEKMDTNDFTMFIDSSDSDLLKYILKRLYPNDVIEVNLKENKNSLKTTFYNIENKFIAREVITTPEKNVTKVYWDKNKLKEINETTDKASISKFYNKNGVLILEITVKIPGLNKKSIQNLDDIELLKSNIENNIEIKEYFENTGSLKSVLTIINGKESSIEYKEDKTKKSNLNNLKNK